MFYIYHVENQEIQSKGFSTEKEALYEFTANGLNAWFYNIKYVNNA